MGCTSSKQASTAKHQEFVDHDHTRSSTSTPSEVPKLTGSAASQTTQASRTKKEGVTSAATEAPVRTQPPTSPVRHSRRNMTRRRSITRNVHLSKARKRMHVERIRTKGSLSPQGKARRAIQVEDLTSAHHIHLPLDADIDILAELDVSQLGASGSSVDLLGPSTKITRSSKSKEHKELHQRESGSKKSTLSKTLARKPDLDNSPSLMDDSHKTSSSRRSVSSRRSTGSKRSVGSKTTTTSASVLKSPTKAPSSPKRRKISNPRSPKAGRTPRFPPNDARRAPPSLLGPEPTAPIAVDASEPVTSAPPNERPHSQAPRQHSRGNFKAPSHTSYRSAKFLKSHLPRNKSRNRNTHPNSPKRSPSQSSGAPSMSSLPSLTPFTSLDASGRYSTSEPLPELHDLKEEVTKDEPANGKPKKEHSAASLLQVPFGDVAVGQSHADVKAKQRPSITSQSLVGSGAGKTTTRPSLSITELVNKIKNPLKNTEPDFDVLSNCSSTDDDIHNHGEKSVLKRRPSGTGGHLSTVAKQLLNISDHLKTSSKDSAEKKDDEDQLSERPSATESEHSLDIFASPVVRSNSDEPQVFKFDSSDPTIPQFDPLKADEVERLSISLSDIDRIHLRQSIREKRKATRRHAADAMKAASLQNSFSHVDALKTVEALKAPPKRPQHRASKNQSSDKSRPNSLPSGTHTKECPIEVKSMQDDPMKDESMGSTPMKNKPSTGSSRARHRRRHTSAPKSKAPTLPTAISRRSVHPTSPRRSASHNGSQTPSRSSPKPKQRAVPAVPATLDTPIDF